MRLLLASSALALLPQGPESRPASQAASATRPDDALVERERRTDLDAYRRLFVPRKDRLAREHAGKWVVIAGASMREPGFELDRVFMAEIWPDDRDDLQLPK